MHEDLLASVTRASAALQAQRSRLAVLDQKLCQQVTAARAAGRSWQTIAKALGVTAQAAAERFDSHAASPALTPPVIAQA
jgi:hypothetical protein